MFAILGPGGRAQSHIGHLLDMKKEGKQLVDIIGMCDVWDGGPTKFNAEGKTHSVYVPSEQGEVLKSAHRAWLRFQELGGEVAAGNRERFLRALQGAKQLAKATKAKSRGKAK